MITLIIVLWALTGLVTAIMVCTASQDFTVYDLKFMPIMMLFGPFLTGFILCVFINRELDKHIDVVIFKKRNK